MVAVLVLEDRDGCKCAWNVAEGFDAGADSVSGLAGASEGGRPDSATVMGVGRSPRAYLRSQPHGGGARSRLLRLEETGRVYRQRTARARPCVRRATDTGPGRQAMSIRTGQRDRGHDARATDGL